MAIDWSAQVLEAGYSVFSRQVSFMSKDGGSSFGGRGIYESTPVDVITEAGAILSDDRKILDIMEIEYPTLPQQGDFVSIPAEGNIPAEGDFEIITTVSNGGGETTLGLRKLMETKP